MEIKVDGKKHMLLRVEVSTVGEVLVEINDYLQANDRALQRIISNGRDIPAEDVPRLLGRISVADIQTLEVISADLSELVKESIDELIEIVPELPVACQELAQILAGEAPEDGFTGFNQLLQIWGALKDREAQVANSLGLEMSIQELEGTPLAKHEADLWASLGAAKEAMENSDYAKLADLLAYDLSEHAEREAGIIEVLRTQAQG